MKSALTYLVLVGLLLLGLVAVLRVGRDLQAPPGVVGRRILGALMNMRGLMELIILNICLEIGVISKTMFSMMVLMALIITFMMPPLLELTYGHRPLAQSGR